MRILVAEDDSRLLTQLDALLQQNGYSVDLADNGEHALFLIKEYSYDLAIVDIGMPKLDGFEVIRKARQADISCPILILTARDRWQEKVEGLDAGADDYLTKPFHKPKCVWIGIYSPLLPCLKKWAKPPSPYIHCSTLLVLFVFETTP